MDQVIDWLKSIGVFFVHLALIFLDSHIQSELVNMFYVYNLGMAVIV